MFLLRKVCKSQRYWPLIQYSIFPQNRADSLWSPRLQLQCHMFQLDSQCMQLMMIFQTQRSISQQSRTNRLTILCVPRRCYTSQPNRQCSFQTKQRLFLRSMFRLDTRYRFQSVLPQPQ